MKIVNHPIDQQLKHIILNMWIVEENNGTDFYIHSFPVGYSFLNIISGADFALYFSNNKLITKSYIAGPTVLPFLLHLKLVKRALTIQLQPHAIPLLTGQPSKEFFNSLIPIENFNPVLARELEELVDSNLPSEVVLLKSERSIARSCKSYQTDGRILYAVDQLIKQRGYLSIEELAFTINLSQRRLQQLFQLNIGLAPKSYARILKLQHFSFQLLKNRNNNTIIPEGYYDQSHFIQDLKRQTGMYPGQYVDYISNPGRKQAYYTSNLYYGYDYNKKRFF
jgi:AraC-like DNA-binding protein